MSQNHVTAKQFLAHTGTTINYLYDHYFLRLKNGSFIQRFEFNPQRETCRYYYCNSPLDALTLKEAAARKLAKAMTEDGYPVVVEPVKAWYHVDYDGSLN